MYGYPARNTTVYYKYQVLQINCLLLLVEISENSSCRKVSPRDDNLKDDFDESPFASNKLFSSALQKLVHVKNVTIVSQDFEDPGWF